MAWNTLYCKPSCATTPTVNLPSQLKHCSHDLWPRNWTTGERLSTSGFSFLKLNVQTVREPHFEEGAEGCRQPEEKMDTSTQLYPLSTTQAPSLWCFWSHDHGRAANIAWLFTLLISGVVTSRETYRLTSAHTHARNLTPGKSFKKRSSKYLMV